jgi:hypothetical protein
MSYGTGCTLILTLLWLLRRNPRLALHPFDLLCLCPPLLHLRASLPRRVAQSICHVSPLVDSARRPVIWQQAGMFTRRGGPGRDINTAQPNTKEKGPGTELRCTENPLYECFQKKKKRKSGLPPSIWTCRTGEEGIDRVRMREGGKCTLAQGVLH